MSFLRLLNKICDYKQSKNESKFKFDKIFCIVKIDIKKLYIEIFRGFMIICRGESNEFF